MNEKFQKILDDIQSSKKEIKVLPCENNVKSEYKKNYSIDSDSLLGILFENTGGIIIDNWIRFYGTGEINFCTRNKIIPFDEFVIAEDILGGLFIYLSNGNIGYFAPDCLEVEDMEIKIGQFLYWCFHGDTDMFYIDYRWENWREDVSKLDYDKGIAFYPFLFANADSFENRTRKEVLMKEIIGIEFEFLKQMNNK